MWVTSDPSYPKLIQERLPVSTWASTCKHTQSLHLYCPHNTKHTYTHARTPHTHTHEKGKRFFFWYLPLKVTAKGPLLPPFLLVAAPASGPFAHPPRYLVSTFLSAALLYRSLPCHPGLGTMPSRHYLLTAWGWFPLPILGNSILLHVKQALALYYPHT